MNKEKFVLCSGHFELALDYRWRDLWDPDSFKDEAISIGYDPIAEYDSLEKATKDLSSTKNDVYRWEKGWTGKCYWIERIVTDEEDEEVEWERIEFASFGEIWVVEDIASSEVCKSEDEAYKVMNEWKSNADDLHREWMEEHESDDADSLWKTLRRTEFEVGKIDAEIRLYHVDLDSYEGDYRWPHEGDEGVTLVDTIDTSYIDDIRDLYERRQAEEDAEHDSNC